MKPRFGLIGLAILVAVLLNLSPISRFVVLVPLLVLAPGYLIERAAQLQLAPLIRPTLWLGLSLMVIPLFYLWATSSGLRMSTGFLWLYVVALLAGLGWTWRSQPPWHGLSLTTLGLSPQLVVVLGIIVLGGAWTRIEQMNDVVAPLWVDSVHHALIIRVVAESGQVPYSLHPYLEINNFIYHWGYHALAASVFQLSGLELPTTMLWLGQVLSFAYILALSGCALAFWRHPLAYVVAAVVVGFISVMPGYFPSWGRYTLLTGGLMLPALLVLSWYSMRVQHYRWAWLFAPLLASTLMTHIVAATMAILWAIVVWLTHVSTVQNRVNRTAVWLACGFSGLILAGPWLATLITRTSQSSGGAARLTTEGSYNSFNQATGLYWTSTNRQLVAVAVMAAALCVWQRRRLSTTLILWVGATVLLANLVWLGLPYLAFFNNNIVALLIFVPITLLIAGGAVALDTTLSQWFTLHYPQRLYTWRIVRNALVVLALLWKIDTMRHIINDGLVIARADDLKAIEWVAQNVPPEGRFAINTDPWLYDISRGTDGGWWILPITGRQVSTPPVIFTYGSRTYYDHITAQTLWLREDTPRSIEDIAHWMALNNYDYIYASSTGRLFNPQTLDQAPIFTALYRNSSVAIYTLTTNTFDQ